MKKRYVRNNSYKTFYYFKYNDFCILNFTKVIILTIHKYEKNLKYFKLKFCLLVFLLYYKKNMFFFFFLVKIIIY